MFPIQVLQLQTEEDRSGVETSRYKATPWRHGYGKTSPRGKLGKLYIHSSNLFHKDIIFYHGFEVYRQRHVSRQSRAS